MNKGRPPASGDEPMIGGYTADELEAMIYESVVEAPCSRCGASVSVEPDARGYDCPSCGATGSVTSPLVVLGLI